MIPLPTALVALLAHLQDEPELIVFIAAFGVALVLFIVPLACHVLFKLLRVRFPEAWAKWLAGYAVTAWLFGAFSQLLLAFTPISGLHRIAIWLASALVIALLYLSQTRLVLRGMEELTEKDKQDVLRDTDVDEMLHIMDEPFGQEK